jgi:GntR family transcriptional repressor for pyruvate dehydrogenase complex
MKTNAKRSVASAAEHVLEWLLRHIEENGLGAGDALPKELDIARKTGAGRSSVREALTALKALGIIRSRKKGGIRIVRDPILLEVRSYLAEKYNSLERHADAQEFRSVMEWGLGELIFHRMDARTLKGLQDVLDRARKNVKSWPDIMEAERAFHGLLTKVSGNRLAELMSAVYTPVFQSDAVFGPEHEFSPREVEVWLSQHRPLVAALRKRDRASFMRHLRKHTLCNMRLKKA